MSDRQLGLWDPRNPKEPIGGFQILDSISGVCMPFWDDGTQCLYLAGKGDGNIRYYEYENDKFEYLSEYKSGDPQRGIAFLPKRGINLHENEVLRCFKTVNDAYVEPVSFIVPRRSEMFQSDIYPPTTGLKPGVSAAEWFGGKTAAPPKISLESVYEGEAPKEVENDYKPSQPATSQPSPVKTEAPKPAPEPTPTPIAIRGPPPSMKDNKDSMASAASKFADKDETSDNESASSFEEIPKPAERRTFTAARQEEKTKGPTITKEPESAKTTPTPTPAPSQGGSAPPAEPTSTPAASAPTSTPSTGGPASALRDALGDIKSQLEQQNRVMSDQSDQIALLLREVSTLKAKVATSEPSDREKDERIRQLELELEEARS
jgi:coronin-1B/1C/6